MNNKDLNSLIQSVNSINLNDEFNSAAKTLGIDVEDFMGLLKLYAENPKMDDKQLVAAYNALKKI